MGIAELRAQLAEGKITKEQFLAELKKLLDAGTITQEEHDAAKPEGDKGDDPMTAEQVQAMIDAAVKAAEQSAGDRVRTEYAAKLQAEKEEKERLLKEKMSAEEKAEFERKKYEADLEEREASLKKREVEIHTINKLTDAGLPIAFKPFLVSSTIEEADANITAFSAAWQAEIKAAVDAKFKDNGGTPPGGTGGAPATKKWSEMTLTERGAMFRDDKDKAIKLAAESGMPIQL